MIDYFAAWAEEEQDPCRQGGNSGNLGNSAEIADGYPVTQDPSSLVTRATPLPELPETYIKGQPDIGSDINEVALVTPVTHNKELIPPINAKEAQELNSWSLDTQRVFVAVLDYLEVRGLSLAHAETLAYTTVKFLMRRHRGPIGFTEINMPDEIAELVGAVQSVLGDEVEVEWRPENAAVQHEQAEPGATLVSCRDCQRFEHGSGDRENALGLCHGQPWDGNMGQWPKAEHNCRAYLDCSYSDDGDSEKKSSIVNGQDPEQN